MDYCRDWIDTSTTKKDIKQMNQILKGMPFTILNISLNVVIKFDDNDFDDFEDKM